MLDNSGVPLVLVQAALRWAVSAREGVGVRAVDALAERLAAERPRTRRGARVPLMTRPLAVILVPTARNSVDTTADAYDAGKRI